MAGFQEIEFKTLDGVTLRGDLYLPQKKNVPMLVDFIRRHLG